AIGARIPAMHLPLQFLQFPFEAYIYSIFGRFEEFAVGVVIALVLARSRKGQAAGWAKELATVLFFGAIAATYADFVGMQHRSGRAYGLISSDFAFVDLLIASFGTAALIWACAKGSRLAHLLLGNPVVEFLGRTSFAFYLLQERLFFEKVHDGIERMTGVNATNPFVMYIGLNVVAAAVYLFLEKPAHRFILNWGSRPKAAIRKLPKRRKALRSAA
ncbi:MAG: hypothetical protein ACXVBW_07460, partial [Bdellovibrionota bacterium]